MAGSGSEIHGGKLSLFGDRQRALRVLATLSTATGRPTVALATIGARAPIFMTLSHAYSKPRRSRHIAANMTLVVFQIDGKIRIIYQNNNFCRNPMLVDIALFLVLPVFALIVAVFAISATLDRKD